MSGYATRVFVLCFAAICANAIIDIANAEKNKRALSSQDQQKDAFMVSCKNRLMPYKNHAICYMKDRLRWTKALSFCARRCSSLAGEGTVTSIINTRDQETSPPPFTSAGGKVWVASGAYPSNYTCMNLDSRVHQGHPETRSCPPLAGKKGQQLPFFCIRKGKHRGWSKWQNITPSKPRCNSTSGTLEIAQKSHCNCSQLERNTREKCQSVKVKAKSTNGRCTARTPLSQMPDSRPTELALSTSNLKPNSNIRNKERQDTKTEKSYATIAITVPIGTVILSAMIIAFPFLKWRNPKPRAKDSILTAVESPH